MRNILKSLKFIYYLAKFNQENYPTVDIKDEVYTGLNNKKIPLKLLTNSNKKDQISVIIFRVGFLLLANIDIHISRLIQRFLL